MFYKHLLYAALGGLGGYLYELCSNNRWKNHLKFLLEEAECQKGWIDKIGRPISSHTKTFGQYEVCYDFKNRIPRWTFECLTEVHKLGRQDIFPKPSICAQDINEDFPEEFKSTYEDYRSGASYKIENGHLAAAQYYKKDMQHYTETFSLMNMIPQYYELKFGLWKELEWKIRKMIDKNKIILLISGPLFLPQKHNETYKNYVEYQLIGKHQVAVPTHFFKRSVVINVESGEECEEQYVMHNRSNSWNEQRNQNDSDLSVVKLTGHKLSKLPYLTGLSGLLLVRLDEKWPHNK